MILYNHAFSPYCQKVRIMLREKGLAFDAQIPGAPDNSASSDYARANPRLEVPTLIDGSAEIFDSTIILEYLEDRYPEPPLLPADPAMRARCRMIEEVCDTLYEGINWGLGEIRFFGRGGDATDTLLTEARRETRILHGWLERQISDSGWLSGEAFGWADLACIPHVAISTFFGLGPEGDCLLGDWVDRTMTRPAVAETVAEMTKSTEEMGNYAEAMKQPGVQRYFRDHRLEWLLRAGGLKVLLDGIARDNVRFSNFASFE